MRSRLCYDHFAPAIDRVRGGRRSRCRWSDYAISVTLDPVPMYQAGLTRQLSWRLCSAELLSRWEALARVASAAGWSRRRARRSRGGREPSCRGFGSRLAAGGAFPSSHVSLIEDGAGSTISRLDGQPAMSVEVIKAQGENTVDTVAAVQEAIAR